MQRNTPRVKRSVCHEKTEALMETARFMRQGDHKAGDSAKRIGVI